MWDSSYCRYEVAEPQSYWYKQDHYDDRRGWVTIRLCTAQYMREQLRHVWDTYHAGKGDPYVMIHHKPNNTMYEGLKVRGWSSPGDNKLDDDASVTCEMQGVGTFTFKLRDIIKLDISW